MPVVDGQHEIEGYTRCRCGRLIVAAVAKQTGGLCYEECWPKSNPLRRVEIVNAGQTITLPSSSPEDRRRRRKRPNRGVSANRLAAKNARQAAMCRLRDIHPDLYAMLYDEERVKRGLLPVVRAADLDYQKVVGETLDWDSVYAAAESSGVVDA